MRLHVLFHSGTRYRLNQNSGRLRCRARGILRIGGNISCPQSRTILRCAGVGDFSRSSGIVPIENRIIHIQRPVDVQVGIADEYIAVVDVNQYRSDMDCFIPLMNKFYTTYGFYPKYPVADAGYGSYNNYIFCGQHGMEKYMKFTMFKKETTDKKYHEDPFRAVNFPIGEGGIMRCPNGKSFYLQYRKNVKGNKYGRQEEVYQCEDCSGCPYAEQCKKTDKNRTVRINRELTAMHQEVIENLESIQGALLRMNRSIQAEGTFGIMKNDRWYKRIVRRGIKSVLLEVFLVSIGHNLYKYHNKQKKVAAAA